MNANTNCAKLHEGETVGNDSLSTTLFGRNSRFDPPDWDAVARAYHELKTTFTASGLVGKAREMHVRERRARSLEVKGTEGLLHRRYLRSLPSRFVTGYGVRAGTLFSWMVALFVVPTAVYAVYGVGDGVLETLAYSTLAFTAVPPGGLPAQPVPLLVVSVETFLGTLSTVLLGYMLGSRERF